MNSRKTDEHAPRGTEGPKEIRKRARAFWQRGLPVCRLVLPGGDERDSSGRTKARGAERGGTREPIAGFQPARRARKAAAA